MFMGCPKGARVGLPYRGACSVTCAPAINSGEKARQPHTFQLMVGLPLNLGLVCVCFAERRITKHMAEGSRRGCVWLDDLRQSIDGRGKEAKGKR
jgi:hypothetical protein